MLSGIMSRAMPSPGGSTSSSESESSFGWIDELTSEVAGDDCRSEDREPEVSLVSVSETLLGPDCELGFCVGNF